MTWLPTDGPIRPHTDGLLIHARRGSLAGTGRDVAAKNSRPDRPMGVAGILAGRQRVLEVSVGIGHVTFWHAANDARRRLGSPAGGARDGLAASSQSLHLDRQRPSQT